MITILAEKPSQAEEYAKAFTNAEKKKGYIEASDKNILNGKTCIITWGFGHLIELIEPEDYDEKYKDYRLSDLPIVPDKFKYRVAKDKKAQFNIVKNKLLAADTIIWAGDIDREGDYIAYLICQEAGIFNTDKTLKRLWVNDLTPKTVIKGLNNLRPIQDSISRAKSAQARAIADWLIGMNGSRLVALILGEHVSRESIRKYLGESAVGRVMTAAQFMVYNREKEIEAFVPQDYFMLEGIFVKDSHEYKGKLIPPQTNPKKKWDGKLANPNHWTAFLTKFSVPKEPIGKIKEVTKEEKYQRSPRLFSLGDLLVYVEKYYDIQPDKAKKIVQELYEKDKYTTYPRTPSNHVTKAQFDILAKDLGPMSKLLNQEEPNKPSGYDGFFVSDKKAAVHAALTPTELFPTLDEVMSWTKPKQIIYMEILKRTFAMFMPKYAYHETVILTEVAENVVFRTSGQTPLYQGWKVLWQNKQTKPNHEESNLPELIKGEEVQAKTEVVKRTTVCPQPFTTGSLLDTMIHADKLLDSDVEENQPIIAILRETEGIGTEATRDAIITKLLDKNLLTLEKKHVKTTPLARFICRLLEDEKPFSQVTTTAAWERYLKKIETQEKTQASFLQSMSVYLGKLPNPKGNGNLIQNVIKRSREREDYLFHELLSELEVAKENSFLGECPVCHQNQVVENKIKGNVSLFQCEGHRKIKDSEGNYVLAKDACPFSVYGMAFQKKISSKQFRKLLEDRETPVIKGLKTKDGSLFESVLVLKETDGNYSLTIKRHNQQDERDFLGECPVCHTGNIYKTDKSLQCDRKGCLFFKAGLNYLGHDFSNEEWHLLLSGASVPIVTKKHGRQLIVLTQKEDTHGWVFKKALI